tara:strand:- start:104 stop:730 length:627 start_codon:yes stop_codon:yes gene_type:complete
MKSKTYILGISGASGSGKSTFAQNLAKKFPKKSVLIIAQDSYYKDLSGLTFEEKANQNFDHPDSLDFKLLKEHLIALKKGELIKQPVYDFTTHSRKRETVEIESKTIIILEGTLLLSQKTIYDEFDCKIYVKLEESVCLERRVKRDVLERGRSEETVLKQYNTTVKPMFDKFIEPSQNNADMIVPGVNNENQINTVYTDIVTKMKIEN